MDRKIVELLMQGASVTTITTGLKVGKGRIKRLREKAKACGYLPPEGRGAGATPLPAYPEAIFPDAADKRVGRQSAEHRKLDSKRGWIEERLGTGWDPVTVFEELPEDLRDISRSSFYRYLARADIAGVEKNNCVIPEIAHDPGEALIMVMPRCGPGHRQEAYRMGVYRCNGLFPAAPGAVGVADGCRDHPAGDREHVP